MSTQDLFGVRGEDLEAARAEVEGALGLGLELRHSAYHGGDYYSGRLGNRDEIILQLNDDGEGPAEEDYADFGILLSIYSPENGDSYKSLLDCKCSRLVLLERSVTTSSNVLRRSRYVDGKEELYFEKQLGAV